MDMPDQIERSPEDAMLLDIVQVLRTQHDHRVAIRQIEEIEQRYVNEAPSEEQLVLRQVAASMVFMALISKRAPFDEVTTHFNRICDLGFHSSHSECAVLLEFASTCGSFGYWEKGLELLAMARARLPVWAFKESSRITAIIEAIQRRLEAKQLE